MQLSKTPTATALSTAFAVEAKTVKTAKSLIEKYVANLYNGGTVHTYSYASNIEKLDLNRYWYKKWVYVNFDVSVLG